MNHSPFFIYFFRESALLTLKGKTSAFYERRMNLIVAHELAHIYFGNLVTNEWWNYAWMNEGFAVFMEWTTTDKVKKKDFILIKKNILNY